MRGLDAAIVSTVMLDVIAQFWAWVSRLCSQRRARLHASMFIKALSYDFQTMILFSQDARYL